MTKITKAVIPAAGLGTRFLPITKAVPKEMLAIVDRPSIQYVAEEAVSAGITDILVIVSSGKDSIVNYFTPCDARSAIKDDARLASVNALLNKANFSFVTQKTLNGNGAAVSLAKDFAAGDSFAVMFGDDVVYNPEAPAIGQLINAYEKTDKCIVGCQRRPPEEAVKYGVVKCGKTVGNLTEMLDIVEKPSKSELPSDLCSLGRFILPSDIFSAIERADKLRGEIYLTSAIRILIEAYGAFACEFTGERFDVGDKAGYLKANIAYGLKNPETAEKLKEYLGI